MSERSHGPLPGLLVALTLVTGLVDGVSFLGLGHVFVANQTGNVVLLGFAVGGAPGLSVPVSLAALGSFLFGVLAGGRLRADRGRLLALGAAVEAGLAALALSAAFLVSTVYGSVVPLGLAMGVQNAVVRRLGVPYLNTTVLTTTLTGLFSEPIFGDGTRAGRRLASVLALFAGAAAGGALATFTGLRWPIGLAVALLAAVSVTSYLLARRGGEWLAPS